jgi:polysaccharide biosynthesis transport protein
MGHLVRRDQSRFPDRNVRLDQPGAFPSQQHEDEDSLDIRRYLQVLLKRKWLIFAVLAAVLGLVALQSFTTTPLYRSSARVQVNPDSSSVLPYRDIYETSERYVTSDVYLQTQLEVLKSRALARRVAERLDLANDPRFNMPISEGVVTSQVASLKKAATGFFRSTPEAAGAGDQESDVDLAAPSTVSSAVVEKLRSRLEVNQVPNSRLVEISWSSPDPNLVSRVVATFAEEFIEHNLQTRYDAGSRASEFLTKQLAEIKSKVEKSEEELIRYAQSKNILNIENRGSMVHQTLEDLNRQLTQVQGELIARTAQYEAVKDATVENFPQTLRTPSIQLLEERLFGLQQNLASLTSQFGNEWPAVIQVKQQIEEVRLQLAQEKGETIRRAKSEYQVAVQHRQMLQAALERQKGQANRLNEDSIQYNILEREVETNKQLYDGLLQRLKEAGVASGMKASNILVVDNAETPSAPYAPQRAADLALGLGLGLLLAVGLAFLMEYMDNTLKTPDDLENIVGLPSLGAIPTMKSLPKGSSRLLAAKTGSNRSLAPPADNHARFRVWEAYRSVRTSILLSHSGKPPKTILVTSAVPAEGKTTTVANLGVVLAQTGARTLLVDLDMRKPALAAMFGHQGAQGISSYLTGNADLSSQIRPTSYPNLFVLPSGVRPPNPAELIGSEKMQQGLKLLADYFKYIVIDSPPVLSVTDALLAAPEVDGVVMVVRGNATPKEAVRRGATHVLNVGGHILGAMINNVDMDTPEYVHFYRHYYDERYGTDFSSAAG